MHSNLSWLENNMITNYQGTMRQALLNLFDWVEWGERFQVLYILPCGEEPDYRSREAVRRRASAHSIAYSQ